MERSSATPMRRRLARLLAMLVCALATCAFVLFASAPASSPAFGEEGGSAEAPPQDGNIVDPTQRADNSFIYDTTINTIFDQSALYEDRTVQVLGEVIGDRIAADVRGYYWITLTETNEEDSATISVLIPEEQTEQIDRYGRYGVTGTTLQVRGTFHQACKEHDGLPDIHATSSAVLARGIDHPDEFVPREFAPGAAAVLLGVALLAGFYYARERMR